MGGSELGRQGDRDGVQRAAEGERWSGVGARTRGWQNGPRAAQVGVGGEGGRGTDLVRVCEAARAGRGRGSGEGSKAVPQSAPPLVTRTRARTLTHTHALSLPLFPRSPWTATRE